MKLVVISAGAWLGAVACYAMIYWLADGRVLWADVESLAFWGGFVVAIAVPVAYAPAMFALKRRVTAWWPFALGGAAVGIVPVVLFAALWSSGHLLRSIFSTASVFMAMIFAVFGVFFGIGFAVGYVRRSA